MIGFEKTAETLFRASAFACVIVTVLIFGFMMLFGLPLFEGGRFFKLITSMWAPGKDSYGIFPMICGTAWIAGLGVVIAFPLSLGVGSLASVLAKGGYRSILRGVVRMMTGIPTVIYGFVGVFLIIPLMREYAATGSGHCIISASLMLSVMISPTMILFFTDSFDSVPESYRTAARSLGGTPVQELLYVILPCSMRGILTGLVMGLGRAVGDTLIALMMAGNAIRVPGTLFDSARTLTSHIALILAADFESLEFKTIFACGMLLYMFTAAAVLLIRFIGRFNREQDR